LRVKPYITSFQKINYKQYLTSSNIDFLPKKCIFMNDGYLITKHKIDNID
jgi:hypothetical protein